MKRGFTLIEVLVVIAIIGILLGIVVTAINVPVAASDHTTQFVSTATDVTIPEPTNQVVDTAGVLIQDQIDEITRELATSSSPTRKQIAVLVVNTTQPLSIEQFGIRVAEKWKVGYRGVDNGAIIIIAVQDRKVRIEVGDGLQGTVTDSQAENILQQDMVPDLKNSEWYDAILQGINGLNHIQ